MVKRPADNSGSSVTPHAVELRRSGRMSVPARDRDIVYDRRLAPKRRRIIRNYRAGAGSPPDINANCPFLGLSYEILDQIASYLLPREAIFLALTSRVLYFGPLSSSNSWLWYRLGRFSELLPGRDDYWLNNVRWYFMFETSAESKARLCRDDNQNPDDAVLGMTFGRKLLPSESPLRTYVSTIEGLPPMGVSYKEMLVSTMLGNTQSGCQWCLQEPLARKFYSGWNMRLCFECFSNNVMPSCRLRQVKIDISGLPVASGRRSIRNGGRVSGAFLPIVERLVRKSYGEDATLAGVLHKIQVARWEISDRRLEVREVYRKKQRSILFLYVREIWDLLRNLSSNVTTPSDHKQLADIREHRVGKLDMYGYLPSDDILLEHVPHLSAIAAYIPSHMLRLDWFIDHGGSISHDPTISNKWWESSSYKQPWHMMRWDTRVDQKPAWFVEAAWRVIVQTVNGYLNSSLSACLWRSEGLQPCFITGFKINLEDKIRIEEDEDMQGMWSRLAYIWWARDEVPSWYWQHFISEDVCRYLVKLGQDFQRDKQEHWARFGIQLHELGTRAPSVPPLTSTDQ